MVAFSTSMGYLWPVPKPWSRTMGTRNLNLVTHVGRALTGNYDVMSAIFWIAKPILQMDEISLHNLVVQFNHFAL